jgi:hypothetical protein
MLRTLGNSYLPMNVGKYKTKGSHVKTSTHFLNTR